jgi:hypothetical protein
VFYLLIQIYDLAYFVVSLNLILFHFRITIQEACFIIVDTQEHCQKDFSNWCHRRNYLLLIHKDTYKLANFASSSQLSHGICKLLNRCFEKQEDKVNELNEKVLTSTSAQCKRNLTCGLLCFPRISPLNITRKEFGVWSSSPERSSKSSTPKHLHCSKITKAIVLF